MFRARLRSVLLTVRELVGAAYPARLRDLARPPPRVWVAGEIPRGPGVAIVGTRKPTPEGALFARTLARELASVGIAIFSGGALGIDAAAHEGALDAGGATVVVAPSSADCPYPRRHEELFDRIVDGGGALVTGFPPGTTARRHHFFQRNEQLAALTSALVVVETRCEGGARNAAAAARRLGRPVLVVPGAPWTPEASGCIVELRLGARVATSAGDVLEALGLPRRPRATQSGSPVSRAAQTPTPGSLSFSFASVSRTATVGPADRGVPAPQVGLATSLLLPAPEASPSVGPPPPGGPDREAVLAALQKGPADPDTLCERTGLPPARVQAWLLTLTLEGILVCGPSGCVSLVRL